MVSLAAITVAATPAAAQEKPNVVMLMSDDAGWADFGAYLGGAALGHATPNIDQSPRKVPCSPTGTARLAAPRAAHRS